jgi:hypothetical protein
MLTSVVLGAMIAATCLHKAYDELHIGVWKEAAVAQRFPRRPGTLSSLTDPHGSTESERCSSGKVNPAVTSLLSRLV